MSLEFLTFDWKGAKISIGTILKRRKGSFLAAADVEMETPSDGKDASIVRYDLGKRIFIDLPWGLMEKRDTFDDKYDSGYIEVKEI